jgi:hypothetical protein
MAGRMSLPAQYASGSVGSLDLVLQACDWQTPLALIDTFESATIVARYNDVSTFEIILPADTEAAQVLISSSRPRILILTATGQVFRSGPALRMERTLAADGSDMLALSGVDDLVWLRRRLAHPQPGSAAPPYSSTAYDVASGPASQVIAGYVNRNAGPLATAARQVPGLAVPTPAPFGPATAASARYQNLLEFVQGLATAADLGIRVRDLTFEVFQPSGGAVFSVELGTLASWLSIAEAPDTTYVYVAGQEEGTARVIREYPDAAAIMAWGRLESFQDRRDTASTAEMDQTGAESLAEGARPIAVAMEALDTAGQQFLRDWNVGDLATVQLGDVTLRDVIVEATVELEPNAPTIVRPVLGAAVVDLSAWRILGRTQRRIRQLERR